MNIFKTYLAIVVTFLALDAAWIGLFLADFYQTELGGLMRERPIAGAAAAFYLVYAVGIIWLVIKPAVEANSLPRALLSGAALGAIAYGTYTITNYAIIDGWTMALVVSDIAWGAFLTMLASGCGYLVAKF